MRTPTVVLREPSTHPLRQRFAHRLRYLETSYSRSLARCIASWLLDSYGLCKGITEARIGRKERLTIVKSSRKGQEPSRACRVSSLIALSVFASLHIRQSRLPWSPRVEGKPLRRRTAVKRSRGNSFSCLTSGGCERLLFL